MLELFSVCGEWIFKDSHWEFIIDGGKGSSISCINEDIQLQELIGLIFEDFGIDPLLNTISISYGSAINFLSTTTAIPPIYIRTDRQLQTFLKKFHPNEQNDVKLCVTITQTNYIQTTTESTGILYFQGLSDAVSATNLRERQAPLDPAAPSVPPTLALPAPSVPPTQASAARVPPIAPSVPVGAPPARPPVVESESVEVPCVTTRESPVLGKRKSISTASSSSCDDTGLCVGRKFTNKKEMTDFMKKFAIDNKFEFKSGHSDTTRYILRCLGAGCPWRFRANSISGTLGFKVQHYYPEHDCDSSHRNLNHRQACSSTLGKFVSSHFEGGKLGLKPKQIMEIVRKDHGVTINYHKAWRAKEKGQEIARGTYSEGYEDLPKWLYILKEKNPGSATFLKVDDKDRFRYAFFSLAASIKGFRLLRKIIIVDGAFLKGKFKGVLLAASAQDGNFNLFPLAFAVVDAETDDAWEWFFECLSEVFPDSEELVFVSDRAPSIAKGLQLMYPKAFHGICYVHFEKNVEKHFKTTSVMALLKSAAYSYIMSDFDELIREIQLVDPELFNYLWEADFRKWSRCHATKNRYNIMTSNLAESLNATLKECRGKPIVELFDNIRSKLTNWFHERRQEGLRRKSLITKEVGKRMKAVFDLKAKFLEVFPVNEVVFEVRGDVTVHIVNLATRSCTCRVFDIDKIPCSHAIAAIKTINLNENDFVDVHFSTQRWTSTYMESVHPHGDEKYWVIPPEVAAKRVLPPNTKVPKGRRKVNRHKSYYELGKMGSRSSTYKCGRCGETGHNKSTCKGAI